MNEAGRYPLGDRRQLGDDARPSRSMTRLYILRAEASDESRANARAAAGNGRSEGKTWEDLGSWVIGVPVRSLLPRAGELRDASERGSAAACGALPFESARP
jgi:hypothetical protein